MPRDDAQAATVIENVLCRHPGVREAGVVHDGPNGLVALVVPADPYLDAVLGRATTESSALGKWRKTFDLTQFTQNAASAPVGFNTMGWNSSYTREPIPLGEMREWVETTVEDVFQLAPKAPCEIGCGTGMLLMRIAPGCHRYVAADFSPVVLERVRKQLETVPAVAKRVELLERRADNCDGLAEDSFDVVVLNSVVQYFPNLAYLSTVMEKAVNIVRPGGHVYAGDLRSRRCYRPLPLRSSCFTPRMRSAAESCVIASIGGCNMIGNWLFLQHIFWRCNGGRRKYRE